MTERPTFEPTRNQPRANGDEQDVFGSGRRFLCSLVNHPGGITKTKDRYRRRTRRTTKQAVRALRYL